MRLGSVKDGKVKLGGVYEKGVKLGSERLDKLKELKENGVYVYDGNDRAAGRVGVDRTNAAVVGWGIYVVVGVE